MTAITWSNDVDPIKTTILGFQNSWLLLPVPNKFKHFSFYKLIGRSLEILSLCTVLENHEPVHVKHGKCIFCTTRRVLAHAHYKLEFDDAEM